MTVVRQRIKEGSQHMNFTELTGTNLKQVAPVIYTTRSLVRGVGVATWLAATKLGLLLPGEFWTRVFQYDTIRHEMLF